MASTFDEIKRRITENQTSQAAKVAEFLKDYFELTDKEFDKLLKKFPKIVENSIETLQERIETYQAFLNVDKEGLKDIYMRYPIIFAIPKERLLKKYEFYRFNFGILLDDFKELVITSPQIVGDSDDTAKEKASVYINKLKIARLQFGKMLVDNPKLFTYSTEEIEQKCDQVVKYNLVDEFVEKPMLFSTPVSSFKVRYMLCRVCKDENLNLMQQNENESIARLLYINEVNDLNPTKKPIPISAVYTTRTRFERRTGVTGEQLMTSRKYQVTETNLETLEKLYEKETQEELTFTAEEKTSIIEAGIKRRSKI